MKLGNAVNNIRGINSYADHKAELELMGFEFAPQNYKYRWDKVKLALLTYKELNGDLLVPTSFVVPEDDST
jgi:hypothetical protein